MAFKFVPNPMDPYLMSMYQVNLGTMDEAKLLETMDAYARTLRSLEDPKPYNALVLKMDEGATPYVAFFGYKGDADRMAFASGKKRELVDSNASASFWKTNMMDMLGVPVQLWHIAFSSDAQLDGGRTKVGSRGLIVLTKFKNVAMLEAALARDPFGDKPMAMAKEYVEGGFLNMALHRFSPTTLMTFYGVSDEATARASRPKLVQKLYAGMGVLDPHTYLVELPTEIWGTTVWAARLTKNWSNL